MIPKWLTTTRLAEIATIIGLGVAVAALMISQSSLQAQVRASNDDATKSADVKEILLTAISEDDPIVINKTLESANIATVPVMTKTLTATFEPSFTPSVLPTITQSPLPTFTPTDFMSPTPSVVIPIGESHFDSYNQIELIVDSVAILPDNSMQWNFSFWNRYTRDVGIGFSNQVTYLADESGIRYSALNDDAGNGPLGNSHWVVQPGERQRHWIIFSPRQGNAKIFTVGMGVPNCYYACWKVFTTTVNFP